jgi:transposase
MDTNYILGMRAETGERVLLTPEERRRHIEIVGKTGTGKSSLLHNFMRADFAWLGAVDADGRSTAEEVEEALYRHRQPLFGAVSIAFFDTTTLWFEGAGGESLGQYGHSKDYRGHLKQVVLGIVLDDADRLIAPFLIPGNTADVTLLLPVVKRLRERFGIAQACIVADRGMISADTIAALEAEKIEYILGVREHISREVRAEVIEDDGLAVPLVIPRQKDETELAIRETTIAGRRYVICRYAEEAKKDAMARAELVAGLERKLAQGDKALVANKGFRRFLKTPEGDGFVIDRAKVEADARFDGLFVLRTNSKIAALQIVLRYRTPLKTDCFLGRIAGS